MNPRKRLMHLLLLLFILSGCIAEDEWAGKKGKSTGDEIPVRITLQMPSASIPGTYAISVFDENKVESIDVLAFKADESKPSGWKLAYRAQGNSITNQQGDNPGEARKQFIVDLVKDETGQQRLVMLANIHSQLENMGITIGMDKDELLSSLAFVNATSWSSPTSQEEGDNPFIPFPMWGEVTTLVNDATTRIDGVNLLRCIARVDVSLAETVTDFTLNEVYVYNSKNKGRIVPDSANLDDTAIRVKAATVPAGSINNITPLRYAVPEGMERAFERSIYLFEAQGVTSDKSSEATCLVVGGTYGTDSLPTYYRLDFFQKGTQGNYTADYRDILRNHRYRIRITSVTGSGYSTPQQAFESAAFNMQSETIELDDSDLTNVVFDGQYMLAVGPEEFSFPCDAITVVSGTNTLSIFTDYPLGWSIENVVGADGTTPITWLAVQDGTTGEADLKAVRWLKTDANIFSTERIARIVVKAGRLQNMVTVTQEASPELAIEVPPSNCYMLHPGGLPILIPVSQANADGLEERIGTNDVLTAELLWTDHPGGVKAVSNKTAAIDNISVEGQGKNGYIRVRPGVEEGNAVIAVKINGEVKWSWHIWTTAYTQKLYDIQYEPLQEPLETKTNNGFVFMDRNLGALTGYTTNSMTDFGKTGMMYQWGRKDPFPGYNDQSNPILYDANGKGKYDRIGYLNTSGGLALSIKNPQYYFGRNKAPNDWAATSKSSQTTNRWNNVENAKTVYDPCPAGWRVPPKSAYSGLSRTSSSRGDTYAQLGYFPAMRRCDPTVFGGASFLLLNSGAYVWTADAVDYDGSMYAGCSFHNELIQADYMSHGYMMRCVKEYTQEMNTNPEVAIVVPPSNCYMLHPGGLPILIPVSQANADNEERIGTDDVLTAELLWTDHAGGVRAVSNKTAAAIDKIEVKGKGKTGCIRVCPGTEEGNSVIAVKVNGIVKWSWHIWTTAYTQKLYDDQYQSLTTPYETKTNNGFVFMDRHLGAHQNYTSADMAVLDYSKTGLLYQWGRKDPTPTGAMATNKRPALYLADGTSSTSLIIEVNNTGSLAKSIENPTTLYFSTILEENWYGSQNNYLWNTSDNKKTVYDPCPKGWRVPAYKNNKRENNNSPWKGADGAWPIVVPAWNNGRTWTSLGYYPASGYWTGKVESWQAIGIKEVGKTIYSRSATIYTSTNPISSGYSAGLYSINGSNPDPYGAKIRRDWAIPVRCVKE